MKNKRKLSSYAWKLLVFMLVFALSAVYGYIHSHGAIVAIMFALSFLFFMAFACAPDNEKYFTNP